MLILLLELPKFALGFEPAATLFDTREPGHRASDLFFRVRVMVDDLKRDDSPTMAMEWK